MSPERLRGPALGKAGGAALLVLLSLALYWPRATWFQSDDFVAVTYAQDPARVAADFTGAQYGLRTVALFWRPLITASFGLEAWLFGADPWGYHLDNCLVHGLNTLLVLLVLAGAVGWAWAFRAALLWALHPAHAGSVLWAVGRVDVHATFWILLSLVLHQRWQRGAGGRLPALGALALGLATKELALCQPLLAACLALGGRARAAGSLRARLRAIPGEAWPYAALVAAWLGWRYFLFGAFMGGYGGGPSGLESLWRDVPLWIGRLLVPLGSPLGGRALGFDPLPAALAVGGAWLLLALRGRRAAERRIGPGLALGVLWCLAASIPLFGFFQHTDNLKHLRLFYLPLAGLMLVAAAGGWKPTLIALLALLPVHLPVRADYKEAWASNRRVHTGIAALAARMRPEEPLFVAGLAFERGVALEMHLGPDRLLLPPFGPGLPRLYPWRPLAPDSAHLQWEPDAFGYPLTQFIDAAAGAGPLRREVPGRPGALFDLDSDLPRRIGFEELYPLGLDPGAPGSGDLRLRPIPPAPGHYRVLILTGHGYTACEIESDASGALSLRRILCAPSTRDGKGDYVAFQLALALDIDREPLFLALVQRLDRPGGAPVAAARRPFPLAFAPSALEFFVPGLGRRR